MKEPHHSTEPPQVMADAIAAPMSQSAAMAGSPPRHAVVAGIDEPSLRLCRFILEQSGFRVVSVDSGIAAVIAARQSHPELIVMDLELRDVSSREAISWLRSNPGLEATPIYILTANAQEEAALAPGSQALRKPLSGATIRGLLEKTSEGGTVGGP